MWEVRFVGKKGRRGWWVDSYSSGVIRKSLMG
jgi:hypothetical protein